MERSLQRVAFGMLFALGMIASARGEVPTEPTVQDRQITKFVARLIGREHLTKHPIDNEIAGWTFDQYIQTLDPQKIYFLQSDIDEFAKSRTDLDEQLAQGDVKFAFAVFQRFLKRIDERLPVALELLKTNHNFKADETYGIKPEKLTYAADEAAARELWRKRIKYELLSLKSEGVAWLPSLERLKMRYESFAKRMHQTVGDEILEMYLGAFVSSFDTHSSYLSPASQANLEIASKLSLQGIGAALQIRDGLVFVNGLVPGGAAQKQGQLKVGDQVLAVGQDAAGEFVDVRDMKLNDVVKLVRGNAGTTVRLNVVPSGKTETVTINIVRAKIELSDSYVAGEVVKQGNLQIGVLVPPSFYMDAEGARNGAADFRSASRDAQKILDGFKAQKVDAVVVDLRTNGGGSLMEVINFAGLFIDEGPILQVKDADGRVQHYDNLQKGQAWPGPLVVLCSKWTSGGAEIFAAAMQDYRRAVIVGDETTLGYGTVNTSIDLGEYLFRVQNPPKLGRLQYTNQQHYRVTGDSIQQRGVRSDIALPSLTNSMTGITLAERPRALPFDQIPATKFVPLDRTNADLVAKLKTASDKRRAASPEFAVLDKKIEKLVASQNKAEISLNMAEFFAERDALKDDESPEQNSIKGDGEVVKRDYYFNEVLAIAADLAQESK